MPKISKNGSGLGEELGTQGGRRAILALSAGSFLLLTWMPSPSGVLIGCTVTAGLYAGVWGRCGKSVRPMRTKCEETGLVWAVILPEILLIGLFYQKWQQSEKLANAAALIHIPANVFVGMVALGLAVGALPFLFEVLKAVKQNGLAHPCAETSRRFVCGQNEALTKWEILLCFLSAAGMITICSKSSVLYPFNDWGDANCFFTVGKSMMNGVVVYRDLFEQKGPLLYFLHGIAWLISHDSFLGVYLLEIAAAFFFLYYSYKSIRLYCGSESVCLIPILAMLTYSSEAFRHGDSAEELCLPFLAYGIWVSLHAMKQQRTLCTKECILIGVMSGCVFWIKFTLVGFYLGWFIVPAAELLFQKDGKRLAKMVVQIASGVILTTLPFVLYFGVNRAVSDWLEVYIYDNIFLYSVADEKYGRIGSVAVHLLKGLNGNVQVYNPAVMILGLWGSLWAIFTLEKSRAAHVLSMMAGTFVVMFMGGRMFPYYSLILSAFLPFGLICVFQMAAQDVLAPKAVFLRTGSVLILLFSMGLSWMLTPNRYLLGTSKKEMPQYQFAEIIQQEEAPTLLNYGFLDGGFYTVCNILPSCKAFCSLSVPLPEIPEMQKYYADNGLCDFLVSRNKKLDFEKYDCIAESTYYFEGSNRTYYLYKLRNP